MAALRQWILWSRQCNFWTYYVTYNVLTLRYGPTPKNTPNVFSLPGFWGVACGEGPIAQPVYLIRTPVGFLLNRKSGCEIQAEVEALKMSTNLVGRQSLEYEWAELSKTREAMLKMRHDLESVRQNPNPLVTQHRWAQYRLWLAQ